MNILPKFHEFLLVGTCLKTVLYHGWREISRYFLVFGVISRKLTHFAPLFLFIFYCLHQYKNPVKVSWISIGGSMFKNGLVPWLTRNFKIFSWVISRELTHFTPLSHCPCYYSIASIELNILSKLHEFVLVGTCLKMALYCGLREFARYFLVFGGIYLSTYSGAL